MRPPGQQGRAAALHARVTAHALGFGLDAPALKAVLGVRAGVAHYLAHSKYQRTRPQARVHACMKPSFSRWQRHQPCTPANPQNRIQPRHVLVEHFCTWVSSPVFAVTF